MRYLFTAAAVAAVVVAPSVASAACTPTGFIRDSIDLTAAKINPNGTVTGDVDATGCNIGIYYGPGKKGKVQLANVHGANYFGIVNNGGQVDITDSAISDIGEKPFNGAQHGVAIYFNFNSPNKGSIRGNYVWNYQKGGITVNGSANTVSIEKNTVIGLGPVNFIAQNGIQAGYTAKASIKDNYVAGNSYTGPGQTASGGVLLVGGDCYGGSLITNANVQSNIATNNDVGVWMSNLDASCNPPATQTRNTAQLNILVNNAVNNTTGNGGAQGYQAGISDQGNKDTIRLNEICGSGYKPPGDATAALYAIDATFTTNPQISHNTFCHHPVGASTASATAMAVARSRVGHVAKPARYK